MNDEDPKPRRFDRVKQHFGNHKEAYLFAAGGLAVGWILRDLTTTSHPTRITNSVAPVFNNNNSSMAVNMGGPMSKIVQRVSDGKIWPSVTEAAKEMNKPVSVLSKHLNEYPGYELIDGDKITFLGLRTAG